MEGKNAGLLIAAFVMIVIGASLIAIIAQQEQGVTKLKSASLESVDITSLRYAYNQMNATKNINVAKYYNTSYPWKNQDSDCNMEVSRFGNATTAFTKTTDYVLGTSGTLTVLNTTVTVESVPNATTITYTYCGDDYMSESWSRTILDLVPGFFALAIMGVGVALFFGVLKKEGLLGI